MRHNDISRLLIITLLVYLSGWGETTAQIISPPEIRCVSTDENNGNVTINWLPDTSTCGPFAGWVLFGATSPGGPYSVVDTIKDSTATSYLHLGANATVVNWYYFMITLRDCPGYAPIPSDTILEEPLITPEMNYVTVVPGGVEIYWSPSPSSQTYGYIIYYDLGGGLATEVDTVYGVNNTFYFDPNARPDLGPVSYTVVTMDGCGNKTLFSGLPHNTIFLQASINSCQQELSLSWNPYINWTGGVAEYQIWIGVDTSAPAVVGQTDGNTTTFTYPLGNIVGDSMCITVKAVHSNGTFVSSSNEVCLAKNVLQSTRYNYIRNVTVTGENQIHIDWLVDTLADLQAFTLSRGIAGNSLTALATINRPSPLPFILSYEDTGVITSENAYYYQVTTLDSCNFGLNSPVGNSILLRGENLGTINRLEWNPFTLQHAQVVNYTVYREFGGVFQPIQTVPASQLYFEEDVAESIGVETFCYRVEADYLFTPPIPGGYSEQLTSQSNIACIEQKPVIYMPNTFVPDGVNYELKPLIVFGENYAYSFKIFDRWGKLIFQTDSRNVGWRGFNEGEALPQGGYVYLITLTSPEGKTYEKKGTVVLLR